MDYFKNLSEISVNDRTSTKNGLTYLDWASAWATIKGKYPDTTFETGTNADGRPWFDDGRTGWVNVTVTIPSQDAKQTSYLPIMDFKNKSIPADMITSMDANKSNQRCLVKCLALMGLGIYIYEKMEDTELAIDLTKYRQMCFDTMVAKCKLSDKAKEKVGDLCKAAIEDGDPRNIKDVDILKGLYDELCKVRK